MFASVWRVKGLTFCKIRELVKDIEVANQNIEEYTRRIDDKQKEIAEFRLHYTRLLTEAIESVVKFL